MQTWADYKSTRHESELQQLQRLSLRRHDVTMVTRGGATWPVIGA